MNVTTSINKTSIQNACSSAPLCMRTRHCVNSVVMIIQLHVLVTWLDLWWIVTWFDRSRNDLRLDLDLSYSQLTWDLTWLALWPKDLWLDLDLKQMTWDLNWDLQQMTCDLIWTCKKWLAYISDTYAYIHIHTYNVHTCIQRPTYIHTYIHTYHTHIQYIHMHAHA